jgi:hypothetical protein
MTEEIPLAGATTTRRRQQETMPRGGGDNEDSTAPCSPALEDGDLNDNEEDPNGQDNADSFLGPASLSCFTIASTSAG